MELIIKQILTEPTMSQIIMEVDKKRLIMAPIRHTKNHFKTEAQAKHRKGPGSAPGTTRH
jgi:hypothetical protein